MKTIKIAILFFYFSSAFSQHSKVCVEYNMIINREENFLKGEHLGSYFQYAMDNASRFRFRLIVDENISLIDYRELYTKKATISSGFFIYVNLTNKNIICQ